MLASISGSILRTAVYASLIYAFTIIMNELQRCSLTTAIDMISDHGQTVDYLDSYVNVEYVDIRHKIVHFVQHSHTDAGWLRTMDEYEKLYVDSILNGTLIELPDTQKFTFANYEFLRSHLLRFPEQISMIKKLVAEGRLEILNGGVVMPDQACTYFDDLLDVYEHGRAYGLKHFNQTSRIGWTIDAFGESYFHSRLLADLGYELVGGNRISEVIKETLRAERRLIHELKSDYKEHEILHYLPSAHYNLPDMTLLLNQTFYGMLDPSFDEFNVAIGVFRFLEVFAESYQEQNIMAFVGDDFAYWNFVHVIRHNKIIYQILRSNSDRLFNGMIFVQSTVEEFFREVKKENKTYDYYDKKDFFPLQTREREVGLVTWTGFYTTNSDLKKKIREVARENRALLHHLAHRVLMGDKATWQNLVSLHTIIEEIQFTQSILMHHDAITGTCIIHVARDYLKMCHKIDTLKSEYLLPLLQTPPSPPLNNSIASTHLHTVVCSQDQPGSYRLSTTSTHDCDAIMAADVKRQISASICAVDRWMYIRAFECLVAGDAMNNDANNKTRNVKKDIKIDMKNKERVTSGDGVVSVWVEDSVMWMQVRVPDGNKEKVGISIVVYKGEESHFNTNIHQWVGLYLMALDRKTPRYFDLSGITFTIMSSGAMVFSGYAAEVKAHLSLIYDPREPYALVRTKVYQPVLSVEYADREIMLRFFVPDIKNTDRDFVTDSNGFDLINRKFDRNQPIEVNYFPVTKFIQITDKQSRRKVTVVVDRAQGGTSLASGMIEVGLVRATMGREYLGTYVNWQEMNAVDVEHRIVFDTEHSLNFRKCQIRDDSSPFVFESKSSSMSKINSTVSKAYSGQGFLRTTLDFKEDGIKLRVYNMHDTQNVTIPDIKEFVKQRYDIEKAFKIEERSLDYNQPIETILNQPYLWRNVTAIKNAHAEEVKGNRIILKPLTMKTFRIRIPEIMG